MTDCLHKRTTLVEEVDDISSIRKVKCIKCHEIIGTYDTKEEKVGQKSKNTQAPKEAASLEIITASELLALREKKYTQKATEVAQDIIKELMIAIDTKDSCQIVYTLKEDVSSSVAKLTRTILRDKGYYCSIVRSDGTKTFKVKVR